MTFYFNVGEHEYEFEYDVPYEVYGKVLDDYTEKEYVDICNKVWDKYPEKTKKFIANQLSEVVTSMNPITIDWVKAREIDAIRYYVYYELIVSNAVHLIEDDVRDEVLDDAEEEFEYELSHGGYGDWRDEISDWFDTQRM